GAPGATMDKDRNRRFVRGLHTCRRSGAKNIEALDRCRPISKTERVANPFPRRRAIDDAPLGQLIAVRRVDELIVGVVERLLIHVEPDDRSLGTLCGRRRRRSVHCTSFPSSARPYTICSAANPATAKRPTG